MIRSIRHSFSRNLITNLSKIVWNSQVWNIQKSMNNWQNHQINKDYDLFLLNIILECIIILSFLSSATNIEFKVANISIFNDILFSILSVFSFSLNSLNGSQLNEILIFHDFRTNESFLKVSMNNTSCLWGFRTSFHSPTPNFIFSSGKEIN